MTLSKRSNTDTSSKRSNTDTSSVDCSFGRSEVVFTVSVTGFDVGFYVPKDVN